MISQYLIDQVSDLAKIEMEKYKVPSKVHFSMAISKGKQLARLLGAREDLVALGTILMDIKLGEAYSLNQLGLHVHMSLEYAKQILGDSDALTGPEKEIIYNSIEAHHGAISHTSLESEIVTNADCYRFIHPMGVTWWNATLGTRTDNILEILKQLDLKLEEKWQLVSLPIVKKELEPYYLQYKNLFKIAGTDF